MADDRNPTTMFIRRCRGRPGCIRSSARLRNAGCGDRLAAEEHRPRWGARPSKPSRRVIALGGFDSCLFRHSPFRCPALQRRQIRCGTSLCHSLPTDWEVIVERTQPLKRSVADTLESHTHRFGRSVPTPVGAAPPIERHATVSEYLFKRRLKAGWTVERAANRPSQKRTPRIHIDGATTTVAAACSRFGVSRWTYYRRRRTGWSRARAASTPTEPGRRPDASIPAWFDYRGRRMSLRRWSQQLDLNYRTMLARIKRGLTFAEALEHPYKTRLPTPSPTARSTTRRSASLRVPTKASRRAR